MDSENSDKEFELNQKRRDLQLLEDQLHMKNKDLQHQEFDLRNADGPEDLSSSKMADLADRYLFVNAGTVDMCYCELLF